MPWDRAAALRRLRWENRQGRHNPIDGLSGTHSFAPDTAEIDPDVSFPGTRLRPITFAISVSRSDAASNGIVFELGSAARGLAVALDGPDLIVAVGEDAASDDGASVTIVDALPGLNQVYEIVVSVAPGLGALCVWVDGQLAGAALSVSGTFGGGWSDAGLGAVATGV